MELWATLSDVLILLLGALVLGGICERLRQSAILGYLLAGTLLGPNALDLISSEAAVDTLAELGVALLLFTIGLEFSWRRLRRMGASALGGGTLQVIVTLVLAGSVALLCGQTKSAAFTIGAIIALSSTATVLRVLLDRMEIDSIHGRQALGILLLQDLTVVPLVLIVDLLATDATPSAVALGAGRAALMGLVLILGFYLLFIKIVPRVFGTPALRRNRELPVLLAIVVGLGSALAAHEMGLSPALGAFVAGLLLAESPYAVQIRADVASLRTLLVTLFFSSIGMLADPIWIANHWFLVGGVIVAIIVGKSILIWIVLRGFSLPHVSAIATGICLAQVGEFSFVVAAVGRGRLIDEHIFKLMVSVTIGTLFLTPYLVAAGPIVGQRITNTSRRLRDSEPSTNTGQPQTDARSGHIIIVGFGPAGQAVGETLYRRRRPTTVIDLNPNALRTASRLGFDAYLGDARSAEVLEHLNVGQALGVVVTVPSPHAARDIVRHVKAMAPKTRLVVRARYHVYRWELEFAGADVVIDEEQHVGTRLASEVRRMFRTEQADDLPTSGG
jgi:CPA2 family monovalent cation:H+ antiporter-2